MPSVRVTSSLWVSALVRRCHTRNTPAFVVSRGAEAAGAIFLTLDRLDGRVDLYGPAPQALLDRDDGERRFQRLIEEGDASAVDERLSRERSFDPDLWVVAIEDREGRTFFEVVD